MWQGPGQRTQEEHSRRRKREHRGQKWGKCMVFKCQNLHLTVRLEAQQTKGKVMGDERQQLPNHSELGRPQKDDGYYSRGSRKVLK